MAKCVILKTDEGIKLMGTTQCSNGSWWTAENCFNYCNGSKDDFINKHQAYKLKACSSSLNVRKNSNVDWYKNRENFVDTDIDYEVDQSYGNN